MGYTAVGKSTLAKKLAAKLDCDIYHSAVTRKHLGLSPKKEDAKAFFFLGNPDRKKVDKIVYLANLTKANLTEASLSHADLRGVNLTEANLINAKLKGKMTLTGTIFCKTRITLENTNNSGC